MVTERQCGTCSLCCKLLRIEDIGKEADTWCQHCKPGKGGCTIYADRPAVCAVFQCEWLLTDLEDAWKPLDSKMVVHISKGSAKYHYLNIVVDIGVPNRWREPQWFNRIKQLAELGHNRNIIVRVQVGRRGWLILPFQEPIEIPSDVASFDITENRYGVRKIKFNFTGDQNVEADKSAGRPAET